jgi:diguanylate cyclase (GGDEF)-like protein/PAS domain S-box-containing protein
MGNWFGETIARKLLLAFFSVFIITYLVTALVVERAVQSSETDSELATLSQLSQIKLNSLDAKIEQLATDLQAWTKLDVMNDIISGDVDKRVEKTLGNLKRDYAIPGQLYAFNAAGSLVASTDPHDGRQLGKAMLPEEWKPHGPISFTNKHVNPFDGDDIVALSAPMTASFSADYPLGTLVMAYHWKEISAALPAGTLLLYHQDVLASPQYAPNIRPPDSSMPDVMAKRETVSLMESTLGTAIPPGSLFKLAHYNGWLEIGKTPYLVNSAWGNSGLLSGWEVVMLRDSEKSRQTVHGVILKLILLGLVLTLPLVFAIRWLAGRLTAPLRQLTRFVSDITGTQDLSRRLELQSNDEIGTLASSFNQMATRLVSGSQAQRVAEARLRATIDNALDAVVQMNAEGIITGWNDQASHVFGWTREEAVGRLLHELIIPPQYREEHVRGMKHYLTSGEGPVLNSRIEMKGLHREGHEFPVELAVTTIEVGGQREFSAFIRDITSEKESEEIIWKQANYDKVTGLPNRHMFHDRLEQEIRKAHRAGLQMALLFIDLDRFKEINDTLGHDMGDVLLKETSRRLANCVRESDTVARLGGDEFTIILSEIDDAGNVERAAQAILRLLSEPFQLGDEKAYVSASIGITMYPADAMSVEDLLKNADQAMYVAKNRGRNQSSYFTPALQDAAQERRRLTHDLRGALAADQFILYFQPIVDMATGRIHKAETLIRWEHPERGMVSPAGFVLIAEETGLINEIGDWVFRESGRWAKRWRDQFSGDFQISVNVSPIQFQSEGFSWDAWSAYLRDIDLAGRNMVIEITEGLLLEAAEGVTDKLLGFRDAGIQVAIDDFGTGYSSLSYLKKFDIDYLKIDRSFVDNLENDADNLALCEAIIVMAHKLGLKVIAEGVETEAQRQLLSSADCDYAQGFLFSRPIPAEEFEALVRRSM